MLVAVRQTMSAGALPMAVVAVRAQKIHVITNLTSARLSKVVQRDVHQTLEEGPPIALRTTVEDVQMENSTDSLMTAAQVGAMGRMPIHANRRIRRIVASPRFRTTRCERPGLN